LRHAHSTSVKEALLRELDHTLQRDFRQTLGEILTELKIRNALRKPAATPDSIFEAICQARILETKSSSDVVQVRAALERMTVGKFGLCVRCGRRIPAVQLERNPLVEVCDSCAKSRTSSGNVSQ
jgi:RNA polymerase-binding transcription factor DksA